MKTLEEMEMANEWKTMKYCEFETEYESDEDAAYELESLKKQGQQAQAQFQDKVSRDGLPEALSFLSESTLMTIARGRRAMAMLQFAEMLTGMETPVDGVSPLHRALKQTQTELTREVLSGRGRFPGSLAGKAVQEAEEMAVTSFLQMVGWMLADIEEKLGLR